MGSSWGCRDSVLVTVVALRRVDWAGEMRCALALVVCGLSRERVGWMSTVSWKADPDEHDFPAAASYLSLIADDDLVAEFVARLKSAPLVHYKAKDMLRASGLPLLGVDNPHVAADLAKANKGKALSPVLLVRGDLTCGLPAQIADGYHRVCASYHLDENTDIPCRIADRSDTAPASGH
jgi:hypothetical protein